MSDLETILKALESEESITVGEIADAMKRRWPQGVIIAVVERDAEEDRSEMLWACRGPYFTSLGMAVKLAKIMQHDCDDDEEDDE